MNQNRPFFSTNTNFSEETVYQATPTNFNGQNVLMAHELQRQMRDVLNTSVMGYPNGGSSAMNNQFPGNPVSNYQVLMAQKRFIPGGVSFSFAPQSAPPVCQCSCPPCNPYYGRPPPNPSTFSNYSNNNPFYPANLSQQMAMSGLQSHDFAAMQHQEQLSKNPFQLRFHQDVCTSSSDLLHAFIQSQGLPDFTNISGIVQQQHYQQMANNTTDCGLPNQDLQRNPLSLGCCEFPAPVVEFSQVRKLTLSKPPPSNSGHVVELADEILRENEDKGKADQAAENVQQMEGTGNCEQKHIKDQEMEVTTKSESEQNSEETNKQDTKDKLDQKQEMEVTTKSESEQKSEETNKQDTKNKLDQKQESPEPCCPEKELQAKQEEHKPKPIKSEVRRKSRHKSQKSKRYRNDSESDDYESDSSDEERTERYRKEKRKNKFKRKRLPEDDSSDNSRYLTDDDCSCSIEIIGNREHKKTERLIHHRSRVTSVSGRRDNKEMRTVIRMVKSSQQPPVNIGHVGNVARNLEKANADTSCKNVQKIEGTEKGDIAHKNVENKEVTNKSDSAINIVQKNKGTQKAELTDKAIQKNEDTDEKVTKKKISFADQKEESPKIFHETGVPDKLDLPDFTNISGVIQQQHCGQQNQDVPRNPLPLVCCEFPAPAVEFSQVVIHNDDKGKADKAVEKVQQMEGTENCELQHTEQKCEETNKQDTKNKLDQKQESPCCPEKELQAKQEEHEPKAIKSKVRRKSRPKSQKSKRYRNDSKSDDFKSDSSDEEHTERYRKGKRKNKFKRKRLPEDDSSDSNSYLTDDDCKCSTEITGMVISSQQPHVNIGHVANVEDNPERTEQGDIADKNIEKEEVTNKSTKKAELTDKAIQKNEDTDKGVTKKNISFADQKQESPEIYHETGVLGKHVSTSRARSRHIPKQSTKDGSDDHSESGSEKHTSRKRKPRNMRKRKCKPKEENISSESNFLTIHESGSSSCETSCSPGCEDDLPDFTNISGVVQQQHCGQQNQDVPRNHLPLVCCEFPAPAVEASQLVIHNEDKGKADKAVEKVQQMEGTEICELQHTKDQKIEQTTKSESEQNCEERNKQDTKNKLDQKQKSPETCCPEKELQAKQEEHEPKAIKSKVRRKSRPKSQKSKRYRNDSESDDFKSDSSDEEHSERYRKGKRKNKFKRKRLPEDDSSDTNSYLTDDDCKCSTEITGMVISSQQPHVNIGHVAKVEDNPEKGNTDNSGKSVQKLERTEKGDIADKNIEKKEVTNKSTKKAELTDKAMQKNEDTDKEVTKKNISFADQKQESPEIYHETGVLGKHVSTSRARSRHIPKQSTKDGSDDHSESGSEEHTSRKRKPRDRKRKCKPKEENISSESNYLTTHESGSSSCETSCSPDLPDFTNISGVMQQQHCGQQNQDVPRNHLPLVCCEFPAPAVEVSQDVIHNEDKGKADKAVEKVQQMEDQKMEQTTKSESEQKCEETNKQDTKNKLDQKQEKEIQAKQEEHEPKAIKSKVRRKSTHKSQKSKRYRNDSESDNFKSDSSDEEDAESYRKGKRKNKFKRKRLPEDDSSDSYSYLTDDDCKYSSEITGMVISPQQPHVNIGHVANVEDNLEKANADNSGKSVQKLERTENCDIADKNVEKKQVTNKSTKKAELTEKSIQKNEDTNKEVTKKNISLADQKQESPEIYHETGVLGKHEDALKVSSDNGSESSNEEHTSRKRKPRNMRKRKSKPIEDNISSESNSLTIHESGSSSCETSCSPDKFKASNSLSRRRPKKSKKDYNSDNHSDSDEEDTEKKRKQKRKNKGKRKCKEDNSGINDESCGSNCDK